MDGDDEEDGETSPNCLLSLIGKEDKVHVKKPKDSKNVTKFKFGQ